MVEVDQQFVEYVVKAIVGDPDKVKVERKIDELGVLLELTVDSADMGKIIGKEGRTAKAIRTLLRVLGAQNNARVNLKIIEPEGGRAHTVADDNSGGAAVDMPSTTTKDDLKDIAEE
ncbi:MAG: KH domain-containing protein [bacterium]